MKLCVNTSCHAIFTRSRFAALASIGPPHVRNVAVSLTIPVAFFIGGGAVPAGIGMMGEHGSFALGIMLYGVLLLGGVILLRYIRFHKHTLSRIYCDI